jgi:hypothetical protein
MNCAVAYVGLVLAWLVLAFAVGLIVGFPIDLLLHFGDVILWRVALGELIAVVAGLVSVLVIRWGRSTLGTPGGSRAGRIVLGIVVILWGGWLDVLARSGFHCGGEGRRAFGRCRDGPLRCGAHP